MGGECVRGKQAPALSIVERTHLRADEAALGSGSGGASTTGERASSGAAATGASCCDSSGNTVSLSTVPATTATRSLYSTRRRTSRTRWSSRGSRRGPMSVTSEPSRRYACAISQP